mgnify:CR=1 FL=1
MRRSGHGADVRAVLKKMCGEGMPQGVRRDLPGEPPVRRRLLDGALQSLLVEVMPADHVRTWIFRSLL